MALKFISTLLLSCEAAFGGTALESTPFSPESILADGVDTTVSVNPYTGESGEVRKGTAAAMLNNVAKLNQLFLQEKTPENEQSIQALVEAIDQLIPALKIVGMFDLFEPMLWIGEGDQPGRLIAIQLYFKHYPEKMTPEIKQKLDSLKISPR